MLIDSHAHLFYPDFKDDLEEVLHRAEEAGIGGIIVPGTNIETSREAIAIAEKHPSIFVCVGFHPLDASRVGDSQLKEIEMLSVHPKVVAIGEIGLDYYYDATPKQKQIEVFRAQIEIAVRRNLPIVVHTRDSIDDAMRFVGEAAARYSAWKERALRGQFHCFTGDADTARQLMSNGFLVSFPGIVTFKNSSSPSVVKEIGYRNIMVETDSPFLTPAPHRGKRNEPLYVKIVAEKIAEICGTTLDEVSAATTQNALKLFEIPSMKNS